MSFSDSSAHWLGRAGGSRHSGGRSLRDGRRDDVSPWGGGGGGAGQQQHTLSAGRDKAYYETRVRESLQESIKTAAETNEIAQSAAEQLDQQSEHLKGIEESVDQISHNLDTSQYLIKGMKSWWGSFVQMFTSPPTRKEGDGALDTTPPTKQINGVRAVVAGSGPEACLTNVGLTESEKEMNKGLTVLSGMLDEMHSRAVEMGNSIGQQNTRLDSIHKKVDTNQQRMSKQKKDMDKLLGR